MVARPEACAATRAWPLVVPQVGLLDSALDERPVIEVRLGQDVALLLVLQQVSPRLAIALFDQGCDASYCYHHWQVSESGYGYCPRGHGKSLDPHW
jgi:hypothetical protein